MKILSSIKESMKLLPLSQSLVKSSDVCFPVKGTASPAPLPNSTEGRRANETRRVKDTDGAQTGASLFL